MRILIYGAGVIGSLYAVLMSKVGYSITVFARGHRLVDLLNNGLRYYEKEKIEKAKVTIIDKLEDEDRYDYIFVPVRTDQLKQALCELKNNKSRNIVTMVNTIEPYKELEKICGANRIIPAFPGAGGSIEKGILNASLTPKMIQPTTFGEIDKQNTSRIKELSKIFRESHIPYQIVSDMHNWQVSHLGMVVPMADAYYMSNNPEEVYKDRIIMKKTAKQIKKNFRFLAKNKMLSPFKFYFFTICPIFVFSVLLRVVYKSKFGHKFMYEHSMNKPQEMLKLHETFYNYIKNEI